MKGSFKRYIDWGIAAVICTVLLRTLVLFCAHRAETNWLFEIEMRSSATSRADLLYDEGQGFNAVSNQYVVGDNEFRTLSFPIPSRTIHALRFDPLDGAGAFSIKSPRFRNRSTLEVIALPLETFSAQAQIDEFHVEAGQIDASTPSNATDPMLSFKLDRPFEAGRPWASFVPESLPFGAAALIVYLTLCLATRSFRSRSMIIASAVSAVGVVVFFQEILLWQSHPSAEARVQLSAPGSKVVRMQLCRGAGPCAYSFPIAVHPETNPAEQEWNFQIKSTGLKDSSSLDSQVRIVQIVTPERKIEKWADLKGADSWKQILTMGRMGPEGKTGISSVPGSLSGTIKGTRLEVTLLGGLTGGIAEITANGQTERVNLYSELPEESFTVSFDRLESGDDSVREYVVPLPSIDFSMVRFSSDAGNSAVNVHALSIEPYNFGTEREGMYIAMPDSSRIALLTLAWSLLIAVLLGSIVVLGGSGSLTTFHALLALYLGAFTWFVFSPGIMDADAVQQWAAGATGQYYTWHPPAFSMLMGAVQWFSSTPAPLCFAGAFLFWFSIFVVIGELCPERSAAIALSLGIIFVPPLWKYSGSVTNSVWACSSFLFCIYFALRANRTDSVKCLVLAALFLLGAILCRHNYLSVIPVLIVLLLARFRSEIGIGKVVALSGGILLVLWLVPRTVQHLPNVEQKPYSFGHLLLNQYLGAVHSLPRDSADWAKEQTIIDSEMGKGALERLLSEYTCVDYYTYFAKYNIITNEELVKHSPFIIRNMLRSIVDYPRAAFEHKLCWTVAFLNLDKRRYGDLVMVETNPFGLTLHPETSENVLNGQLVLDLAESGAWYQTGVFFLVSMVVGFVALFLGRVDLGWVTLFSLFHVLGYFITDVCGCWRYLLPNYVLAIVITGTAALSILLGSSIGKSIGNEAAGRTTGRRNERAG